MTRACTDADRPAILAIVNAGAEAYRGVIPPDGELAGVMGIQPVHDVTLIRHAYVAPAHQRRGIGGALLEHLLTTTGGRILVGTWAAATWAIDFYRRYDFQPVARERVPELLRTYWSIPERQIETSVVLER